MTRDEIINMAQEAASPDTIDPHCDGWWTLTQEELERFFHAAYVAGAAAEREACAELCEATYEGAFEGVRPCFDTPQECAAAIRARGEK